MRLSSLSIAALAASLAAAAATPALAQSVPLKPGLWNIKRTGGEGDADAARMKQHLDKLSPAQRAQVESMMKAQGLTMNASGTELKMCMTKDTLDPSQWDLQGREANCKTDYASRTSSLWKFRTVCPNSQSDGEIVFAGPENYTINVSLTSSSDGAPKTRQIAMQGHWLGADCGDVKPFAPMKK